MYMYISHLIGTAPRPATPGGHHLTVGTKVRVNPV